MVVGSEEMENNGCFMPIISSEKDSEIFFSKLKDSSYNINPNLKSYFFENKQELYNSINKP